MILEREKTLCKWAVHCVMQYCHDEISNIHDDLKKVLWLLIHQRNVLFSILCTLETNYLVFFGFYHHTFYSQKYCNLNMTGSHAPTNFIDPKLREKRVDYNQQIVIPQNKIMFNTCQ